MVKISAQVIINFIFYSGVLFIVSNGQFLSGSAEKESFKNYGNKLAQKYRKDYLSAIFERNATVKEDFASFANSHLTPEMKSDLKAVRIYKKVGGVEMPVINFSSDMDSWLGVLPQWKRVKAFFFNQMEGYVDSHPDILNNVGPATTSPLFFQRRTPTIK